MTKGPWVPISPSRRVLFAAILLTGLAALLWTAVALPGTRAWVQGVDDRWHDDMAAHARPPLLGLARGLAWLGSTWGTLVITAGVGLGLLRVRSWTRLGVWLTAVIPAQLLTLLGKTLYARPRPDDRLVEVSTASFPSAHACDAAALSLALVLLFAPSGPRRRLWMAAAVAYAVLMAWSRTYLRVHWLSDVSAGVLLGAACALWSALWVPRVRYGGSLPCTSCGGSKAPSLWVLPSGCSGSPFGVLLGRLQRLS